jgi:hypothetical protein
MSLGTQKPPLVGGSNAATGKELKDTSFGLSCQGFINLFVTQLPSVMHSVASSL